MKVIMLGFARYNADTQISEVSIISVMKALQNIITVDHLGLAIRNTERAQILNKMSIAKIEDYLGLPAEKAAEETTKEK